MSCELPEFFEARTVTLRKPSRCCETLAELPAGSRAVRIVGKWAGEFANYTMHPLAHELFEEATKRNNETAYPEDGPGLGWLGDWISNADDDGSLKARWDALLLSLRVQESARE